MNVGVLNESGKIENRAGLSPSGISLLVEYVHTVYVQTGAGLKAGYSNEEYSDLGARCVCLSREYFQKDYR